MSASRYVAIGDSQTEGLLDPDGRGGFRGWADRFAVHLADADPHLQYANLAIRGRLLGQIHDEQLAPALAMRPDLVTVMGGLNDVLRPGFDLDTVVRHLEAMLSAVQAAGAVAMTNTFPDIAAIAPVLRRLGPRVEALNAGIRAAAGRHGALLVDFAERGVGADLRLWSPDRIHANPLGHRLIAAAFADTLGLPDRGGWDESLPWQPPAGWVRTAAAEAQWVGTTLLPWVGRRLRGRSSGDGVAAKRPRLTPVAPLFHIVRPGEWPSSGDYRPPSLREQGFTHLSFADQVPGPANALYGDAVELAVVELDGARIGVDIRVEDSYGEGVEYPHAYGPIPVDAAVAVHPLRRDAGGAWVFSPDPGAAVGASPDR
ncbi:DUF952 domain-containing protein [uncultured Jatrophihabitans sp.]|uniref:DUF952 domain-containing protein n=1 Tax=uncultured Jatrophihabitans sp. TaxID=1610747 RepID=UPI0035CAFE0C